jgi:hypothetical protein
MKKSNKILLGGFVTFLLIISVFHIILYAKYKKGDLTIYDETNELKSKQIKSVPQAKYVVIRNLNHATITFGEVPGVEENPYVKHDVVGDSLIISGYVGQDQPAVPTTVVLPYNSAVSISNSMISCNQPGENAMPNSPSFSLQKTQLTFFSRENPFHLTDVRIVAADSSTAFFTANTHVKNLNVQLWNSAIDYHGGDLGQLNIVTDSVSRISLQSKHLLKANIRTTTQ